MKYDFNRDPRAGTFAMRFDGLTKEQAKVLLLAYVKLEQAAKAAATE